MICCVRSAIVADVLRRQRQRLVERVGVQRVGAAETAASACSAVRTTLLYGCCAVSETPAVWVWKRSCHERGFLAPNRFFIASAHSLRAARYLAISSKKSECELKKNDRRGTKSSTSRPASTPYRTYSRPSRSVNASSCSDVEPASRM